MRRPHDATPPRGDKQKDEQPKTHTHTHTRTHCITELRSNRSKKRKAAGSQPQIIITDTMNN